MTSEQMKTMKSWDDYFGNNTTRPVEPAILAKIDSALKPLPPNSKVLDAGCGCGKYSVYVNEKGFGVTGIDYSAEAVAVAKKKTDKKNGLKFDCVKLDGVLPYKDESFEMVMCVNTLHCLYDDLRQNAIDQMKRVLKKNGVLYLTVLSTRDKYLPRKLWQLIGDNTYKDSWSDRIFHFYTKKEITEKLKGFKIADYELLKIMVRADKQEQLHSLICVKS